MFVVLAVRISASRRFAPGVLAELARARVVGARGGDLVLEVAQELLAEVADARVADLRLELAARALRDLPSATGSDFFASPVARRWNLHAAVLGRRRRVLDALRRRRVLVGEVEARVLADLGRKRVRNARNTHFEATLSRTARHFASNARAASTSVSKVPRYSVFLFGILMWASHLPECDGKSFLPVERIASGRADAVLRPVSR